MNMIGLERSSAPSVPEKSTPSILAILGANTGCEWIRIIVPFEYLKAHGINARWIWERDIYQSPQLLASYDILVLPRRVPMPGQADVMRRALELDRQRGKHTVYEIDDDPFSDRFTSDPEELQEIMGYFSAATVSTRELGKHIEPYIKPYVFENHVSAHLFDMYPDRRDPEWITIGLMGSSTHYDDWKLVDEPLHRLAEKHSHVRFLAYGYCPDYLSDLPRLTVEEARPYLKYPELMKSIDIGLAPLISDAGNFNRYKSPIKVLEYAVAGAAPVASDFSVYRQVDAIQYAADDQWFDVLDELVSDRTSLNRLKKRSQKWVRKHRTLETRWPQLLQVYQAIKEIPL